MKPLLEKYGYTYSSSCNCDGFYIEKFNNGEYQVRLSDRKGIFKLKHKGRSITGWIAVSKIEETLKQYHSVALQA